MVAKDELRHVANAMPKSVLITATRVGETALATVLAIFAVILCSKAWKEHVGGGGLTSALLFGGTILAICSAFASLASWGLWKRTRWAWEMTLITNAVGLLLLIFLVVSKDIGEKVSPNAPQLGLILVFLILVVLCLSKPVRSFFRVQTTSAHK